MSKSPARRGVLAAGITGALLLGMLAASQAQASTLYACVKKNGSAHLYSKKPKCKKGESKLNWNNVGPAGKNGANGAAGAGGANGAGGAAGQPQKAVAFNSALSASFLSTVTTPLFTLNGVTLSLACSNVLITDITSLELGGPDGTLASSGMTASRVNGTATESTQQGSYTVTLPMEKPQLAVLGMNGSGVKGNMGHVHGSVLAAGAVIAFDTFLEVNEGSKNCVARGIAFSIPT
jgi:hypothetical protein